MIVNPDTSILSSDQKRNIDFARRSLVSTIYAEAILEGISTTYPDTEAILENGKINNMTAPDVMKIINLKHAWDFILDEDVILAKTDYALICKINEFINDGFYYNAGKLRDVPVRIGGTSWTPDFPIEADIKESLNKITSSSKSALEISIELLLFITKKQIFIDGNKRTSLICANHFLIAHAGGLIVIPAEKVPEYKELLVEFYETDEDKAISDFLKSKCYLPLS